MTLPLPDRPRRLVYVGTPLLAVPTLRALVAGGWDVPLVVTRRDARRGRGSTLTPSPVKAAAQALGIPVSHDIADAATCGTDLGVVVAFGELIPDDVLAELPMVNLHFSLLPRWRGAAPVERALLAGDTTTGVCLMDVVHALDAGDVFGQVEVPIDVDDTLESLRGRLVEEGTTLLLGQLRDGFGVPVPQVGEVTYARKISAQDVQLDLAGTVAQACRVVAVGGAWTTFRGKTLKVWAALPGRAPTDEVSDVGQALQPGALVAPRGVAGPQVMLGDGLLHLVEVQPEGRARQPAAAWWNGVHAEADARLGA